MDLINSFLNITAPVVTFTAILFFLPTYLFFKFLFSVIRTVSKEDVAGKVVLITGASSGIGQHLAYEYAKRGACLALVARRELRLREVAAEAELLGSPNAITIPGDVSKADDCKNFVNVTVNHFGRLDHLVANAGVFPICLFEDYNDITTAKPSMDINFWGSAYSAYYAIPYLKQTKGKIIAIASAAGWLPSPRMAFYNASKAAVIALYETLRVECGEDVGVTIITPGLTKSEMTSGKFLNKEGKLEVDEEMRDVQFSLAPMMSTEDCAKAVVDSACRGDKYVIQPSWMRANYFLWVLWPEMIEWWNRFILLTTGTSHRPPLSKRIVDIANSVRDFLTLDTDPFHELDRQMHRRYPYPGYN